MISLVIPSRGRPGKLGRLIRSATETAVGQLEFLIGIDEDERDLYPSFPARWFYFPPKEGSAKKVHAMQKYVSGAYLRMVGDDEVFRTPGWDEKVKAEFSDPWWAVVCKDGNGWHGHIPFISREWLDVAGYYPNHFHHFWADTWVKDIAQQIGRYKQIDVLIEHLHPKHGHPEEKDHVYALRGGNEAHIWEQTKPEREELAERLRAQL